LRADSGKLVGTTFVLPPNERHIHVLANGYPINFWGMDSTSTMRAGRTSPRATYCRAGCRLRKARPDPGDVVCEERLDRLLNHCRRRAA
jgi:hypothetical protein